MLLPCQCVNLQHGTEADRVTGTTLIRWKQKCFGGFDSHPSHQFMTLKYTEERLREAVKHSTSVVEVMEYLGKPFIVGGGHSHISRRIRFYAIDTSHFNPHKKGTPSGKNKKHWTEYLIVSTKHYKISGTVIRKALLESGREYVCVWCQLSNSWNNKPLKLEVDHINGNCNDNRAENLRFLCPNCHSQTSTHRSLNQTYNKDQKCENCVVDLPGRKRRLCALCQSEYIRRDRPELRKGNWPSNEQLKLFVWQRPLTVLANEIGVSSKAILKQCRRLDIEVPGRGYWQKIRAGKLLNDS